MKNYQLLRKLAAFLLICSAITFTSCDKDDDDNPVKPDLEFIGLTNANQLLWMNANASTTVLNTVSVTGLQSGETLLAIDFRPATGQLYGLGSSSRLYTINLTSGAAIMIGAGPFTPAINGTVAGFDFNPTVDRIRLVTNTGQNLRLHPETGVVAATDGNLNPGGAAVIASAYNNSVSGATGTTLFNIDIASGNLVKQDPPNDGTLVNVGSMGVTATGEGGFDISPDNNVALASLTVGGANNLYQINLSTGLATNLGNLGSALRGIAIPSAPVAYLTNDANNLIIVNALSGTTVNKMITGMAGGETVLGLDFRPLTGQLFALGSTSIIYSINLGNGTATAVGTQFSTLLSGTSFGFDFNPTVDRIRVTSNTGQNLRLNPIVGGIAVVDGNLNPGTPAVSASAYTNNFAGATTTVLFNIDATTDKLYRQDPPNAGTLVEVGALGIDVQAEAGFDIGGTTGMAYALLTVGSATKLYSINLTTGAATAIADMPAGSKTLAVGLGM